MYYEFIQRYKRRIVVVTVAFLVVIIMATIAIYVSRIGKLPVTIAVVPDSATITVDGQKMGSGTQWLKPGTYKVEAKKDGFSTSDKSLIVTSDKSQNVIAISLVAKSSDAKKWAASHQSDYSNNEQYGAIAANQDGQYFAAQNPITKKLPFIDPYFTISYVVNSDNSITITIATPSPRYRFYAIEKIRQLGFDPTNFTIDFKDFHNPLEQK